LKVFVTGHKGFVGLNLNKALIEKDIRVFPYSNPYDKITDINILYKDQFHQIDKDVDAIVHLAAKTSINKSLKYPYNTYYNNIIGTLNVLDFARERKIKKIINVSTYVYGNPIYLPIDENHPINPHSPYNKSKIVSENLCKFYSEDYGIDIVTLRPFYLYGPLANSHSFIPSVVHQIKKNCNVYLSSENTKRDFLFIDDFIELLLKILDQFPEGYNVYNVGYGKSNSLEEVIHIIEKIKNVKAYIHYDKAIRSNDIMDMIANNHLVTKTFCWYPKIDIEKGLNYMLDFMY
jgi:UDP-glucose 4-epimerase